MGSAAHQLTRTPQPTVPHVRLWFASGAGDYRTRFDSTVGPHPQCRRPPAPGSRLMFHYNRLMSTRSALLSLSLIICALSPASLTAYRPDDTGWVDRYREPAGRLIGESMSST